MAGALFDSYVEVRFDETELKKDIARARSTIEKGLNNVRVDTKSIDGFSNTLGGISGKANQAKGSLGGFGSASKNIDDATKSTKSLDKSLGSIGITTKTLLATFGGFAAAGFFGEVISNTREFQSNIGVLQVSLSATDEQMERLDRQAIALGNDLSLPGTSAGDAAAAMTELAKAGLDVNDTLAASRGVLQLSAAGQVDNAFAALTTANALNAFNLEGIEATRVADLLAGAANASSASVESLALGFQQGGASAAAAGFKVEELATGIAALANSGIKGSDAGTSLKTFIANLVPDTDKAKKKMAELNLSFTDAEGNFVSLSEISGRLQTALTGLSESEKILAVNTIFGTDASRAALVLAKEGAKGYDELAAKVTKQGSAAALAAAQNKGLGGIIDGLKSTFETFTLRLGKSAFPAVGPALQDISVAAGELAVAIGPVLGGSFTILGKGLQGVTPIVKVFSAIITPLVPVVETLADGLSLIPTPLIAIGVGLTLVNKGLDKFEGVQRTSTDQTNKSVSALGAFRQQLAGTTRNADTYSRTLLAIKNNTQLVNTTSRRLDALAAFGTEGNKTMERLRLSSAAAGTSLKNNIVGGFTAARTAAAGFGSSLVAALGGPAGIAVGLGLVGVTSLVGKLQEGTKRSKELKEEANKITAALKFDVSTSSNLDRVTLILKRIEEAGGRGAKAIENLKKQFSDTELSRVISDTRSFENGLKDLNRELEKVGGRQDFAERIGNSAAEIATFGKIDQDKRQRELQNAIRDLKELNKEAIRIERTGLIAKAAQASTLGLDELSDSFTKQAELLKKNGSFGSAYTETLEATRALALAQGQMNKEATDSALSLDKNANAAQFNSEALGVASDAATKLDADLLNAANSVGVLSAKFTLSNIKKTDLASFAIELENLAKTNPDKIPDFGKELTNRLGVDPAEAAEVLEGVSKFREEFNEEYLKFIEDAQGKLPGLDNIFAEKFEFKAGGPSLETLKNNSKKAQEVIVSFQTDIQALIDGGQSALAGRLAAQGPQIAGLAADQAANAIKTGKTKTIQELNLAYFDYTKSIDMFGQTLGPAAAAALGQEYGIDPSVLIQPQFTLGVDEAQKQEIADKLVATQAEIESLVATKSKTTNVAARRELSAEITSKKAELAALSADLDSRTKTAFTNLETQASASSKKVASTFSDSIKGIPKNIEDQKGAFDDAYGKLFTLSDRNKKDIKSFTASVKASVPSELKLTFVNSGGKPGANALGSQGTPWRGGLTVVGERGPELLDVPRGTNIYNNQASKNIIENNSRGGDTYVINGVSFDDAMERIRVRQEMQERKVMV